MYQSIFFALLDIALVTQKTKEAVYKMYEYYDEMVSKNVKPTKQCFSLIYRVHRSFVFRSSQNEEERRELTAKWNKIAPDIAKYGINEEEVYYFRKKES